MVFVVQNLKWKERRENTSQPMEICFDDMPSDDEWITENERQFPLQKESFLDVLDRAARREAYNSDENELEEEAATRNAREGFNLQLLCFLINFFIKKVTFLICNLLLLPFSIIIIIIILIC